MKAMYIQLFAACCLIATISQAAAPKSKRLLHPDPRVLHEGKPSGCYQKNTISHPAQAAPSHPYISSELAPLFQDAPCAILSLTRNQPEVVAWQKALEQGNATFDEECDIAALLTSTPAAEQLEKAAGEEARPESPFDPKKHIQPSDLTGFTFLGGYGLSLPKAVCLAIHKEIAPGSVLRVKMPNSGNDLNAVLPVLASQASLKEQETILAFAAQNTHLVKPETLTATQSSLAQTELAALATCAPFIDAARAAAAQAASAQAVLKTAQEKLDEQAKAAASRRAITDIAYTMAGLRFPETPQDSSSLPSHELVACIIDARKTALQAKPIQIGGAASSEASSSVAPGGCLARLA